MGADGHIQIYSKQKLKEKFDEKILKAFYDFFGSSTMYHQTLEGKEYITRYHGDNLYGCSDTYDVIQSCYIKEKDEFNKNLYNYDEYCAKEFMELSKDERLMFREIIEVMENECRLTSWEVWT